MRGLRVLVAVPTHDQVTSTFAYDLGQMMGFNGAVLCAADGPVEAMSLTFVTGTYVHTARQQLAELALEQQTDYVLWLDSDMRFPKDILLRLLRHRKDIVGINYSTRGIPPNFVAIKHETPPERLVTRQDSEGLEEVETVGFGAVLMKTEVLAKLRPPDGDGGPWFQCSWDPALQQHVGEDAYFCRLLRAAGHTIYVDHDLSKDCAHTGTFEYRIDHPLALAETADAPE